MYHQSMTSDGNNNLDTIGKKIKNIQIKKLVLLNKSMLLSSMVMNIWEQPVD